MSGNFSHNEISLIDARAFADVAFSVLDLSSNHLTRLSLYGADSADVLRADDNQIGDVDDRVFRATRDLHLANNRLRFLRYSCDNDTQLRKSSSTTEMSLPQVVSLAGTATQSASSSSQLVVLDVSGNSDLGSLLDSQNITCYSLVGPAYRAPSMSVVPLVKDVCHLLLLPAYFLIL